MSSSIELGRVLPKTNSVGGVSASHLFYNASGKEMKYITFTYVPYNSVKDMVTCTVSKKSKASGRLTGPVAPGYFDVIEWDNLWYNPTVSRILIDEVYIEYMDGTTETIDGKDIVDVNDPNSSYTQYKKEKAEKEEKAKKEKLEEEKKKKALKMPYTLFGIFASFGKVKENEGLKFHLNQGICLFIIELLAVILAIAIAPVGTFIGIALFVFALVLSNKCQKAIDNNSSYEIPLISKIKFFK